MFWHHKRALYSDGVIDLPPLELEPPMRSLGFGEYYDYEIRPAGRRRQAGQISLRLGESAGIYYFGHIGYHVDPPYRGRHWALRACRLLEPLLRQCGAASVVITCDPDNLPSKKTIEALGAVLERTVDVPENLQRQWGLSPRKCRYIWRITPSGR